MKEVKCPKCNSVFEMDASGYADIVKQVRSEEFNNFDPDESLDL